MNEIKQKFNIEDFGFSFFTENSTIKEYSLVIYDNEEDNSIEYKDDIIYYIDSHKDERDDSKKYYTIALNEEIIYYGLIPNKEYATELFKNLEISIK